MAGTRSFASHEEEIVRLTDLSRSQLVTQWIEAHGAQPPKGIRRRLLCLGIAYELQAKRYGALKPSIVRRLCAIAMGVGDGNGPIHGAANTLGTGTRLIREWNGTTHVVDVVEDGFTWQGETYLSLSAVARAITGARWSGPRFFGVGSGGS